MSAICLFSFLFSFAFLSASETQASSEYDQRRNLLISKINNQKYGSMKITEADQKFLEYFEQFGKKSFEIFPDDFYYSLAIKYKDLIENIPFFDKLKLLPKGGLLHHHLADAIDPNLLLSLLDDPNIYLVDNQFMGNIYGILIYNQRKIEGATKMTDIKTKYIKEYGFNEGTKIFEKIVRKNLTIFSEELKNVTNNDLAWDHFLQKIFYAGSLIQYRTFYYKHIMNIFKECVENNIFRFETRISMGQITNEYNELITLDEEMKIYEECLFEIKKIYPRFSFGIIVQLSRTFSDEMIEVKMREAYYLKSKYGEIIIGLDFDGDENSFRKFQNLSTVILSAQKKLEAEFYCKLPLILHCGESLKLSNQNPIDGVLLESKRFGHGLNLLKFPYLLEIIKNNDVCIEVNPIGNQLLKNVIDLRWHPAITYLGMGIKIVISNDDPTIYGTKGINYDLIVAMAAFEMNIIDLKRVLLNSIECSIIGKDEKKEMTSNFYEMWDKAISEFNKEPMTN